MEQDGLDQDDQPTILQGIRKHEENTSSFGSSRDIQPVIRAEQPFATSSFSVGSNEKSSITVSEPTTSPTQGKTVVIPMIVFSVNGDSTSVSQTETVLNADNLDWLDSLSENQASKVDESYESKGGDIQDDHSEEGVQEGEIQDDHSEDEIQEGEIQEGSQEEIQEEQTQVNSQEETYSEKQMQEQTQDNSQEETHPEGEIQEEQTQEHTHTHLQDNTNHSEKSPLTDNSSENITQIQSEHVESREDSEDNTDIPENVPVRRRYLVRQLPVKRLWGQTPKPTPKPKKQTLWKGNEMVRRERLRILDKRKRSSAPQTRSGMDTRSLLRNAGKWISESLRCRGEGNDFWKYHSKR